jgi:hypothetical protein
MKGIYICVTPVRNSPVINEMKDRMKELGFEKVPTPIADSWCKKADDVERAKEIIREINKLGFGTAPYYQKTQNVLVDLADENPEAWNALFFFKQENNLV